MALPGFGYIDGHDHPELFNRIRFQDPVCFDAENVRNGILKLRPKVGTLLISFEDLSGHPYNAAQARSVILDKLKMCFPKLRLILFLRRQDTFAVSSYLQTVSGGNSFSLTEYYQTVFNNRLHTRYIAPTLDYFLYQKFVDHMYEVAGEGNCLVVPYEKFTKDNLNVIKQLLGFLDIAWAIQLSNSRSNSRKGVLYTFLVRVENYFVSRRISSNSSFFSGIPYYHLSTKNWKFITLKLVLNKLVAAGLFYDKPYKDRTGTAKRILELCENDNKELDKRYGLELRGFGYYQ
jgi:hypothetical protein